MKIVKNILMVVSFTAFSYNWAKQGQAIKSQLTQNNQEQQEKSENIERVVGEILRIGLPYDNSDCVSRLSEDTESALRTMVFKHDGYEVEVAPGELMLEVGVKHDYCDMNEEDKKKITNDWDTYTHPRLEMLHSLPLHLLLNEKGELKDEGEEVIIYCNSKRTHERIKVVLTIRTADIVAMSDLVDYSKKHYIVRDPGYRPKIQSYLDKNLKFINASLDKLNRSSKIVD